MGLPRWLSTTENPPASAEDAVVGGSIPGLGRCLEEENGYPLQYSYLENPMDRRTWQAQCLGLYRVRHH